MASSTSLFNPCIRSELVQLYGDLEDLLSDLLGQIDLNLESEKRAKILQDFEQSHHVLERYRIF